MPDNAGCSSTHLCCILEEDEDRERHIHSFYGEEVTVIRNVCVCVVRVTGDLCAVHVA